MSGSDDRQEAFRSTIAAFIEARREAKLKDKEDDAGTASRYDYSTWLADAARRVGQIQAVTHVLKATHPDARGSSLHAAPGTLPQHTEIGTHLLGEDYTEDVVGNAAALDVFKFLKIEVAGRRLLDWMQAGDIDLRSALHPDPDTAASWMESFGNLIRSDPAPSSHEVAKQVYWLVGEQPSNDSHYHLLQPLFSSSLAHAVHKEINDAFWEEPNKSARKAKWDGTPAETAFIDYRNVVARKLGGTKPQNISQLNSERRGLNYLLASLPPRWKQEELHNLLHIDSALDRFNWFLGVRPLMNELSRFLESDPPNNMETRVKREGIEQAIGAYLPIFAEAVHAAQEPGWTQNPHCKLPLCEKLWLDPKRLDLPPRTDNEQNEKEDEAFEAAYNWGDWQDEVAGRFANWVNKQLHDAGLTTVGDAEYKHWAKQAIVEAAWPVPMQRRAPTGGQP